MDLNQYRPRTIMAFLVHFLSVTPVPLFELLGSYRCVASVGDLDEQVCLRTGDEEMDRLLLTRSVVQALPRGHYLLARRILGTCVRGCN